MRITSKLFRLAAISAIGLFAAAVAAPMGQAQDQNPPPKQFGPRAQAGKAGAPPSQVVATKGDWTIQCETIPAAQAGGDATQGDVKQCGMVQSAKSDKNPKAQLTLVIVKMKQGDKMLTMMRVMAPIGVFLPTGVALEIDGAAVGRVPFTRCMPQLCMAFAEASPDTLAKLKKGKGANFIIYEAPGLGLPMSISLNGFSDALTSLENM